MDQNMRQVLQAGVPRYYKPLSLKLFHVMEDIGASVETRDLFKETNTTIEIMSTICFGPKNFSNYIFGSSMEGTTIPKMMSDVDDVYVLNSLPVELDISDTTSPECLLFVQDRYTHAGYAKLQVVHNGVPLSRYDTHRTDMTNYRYVVTNRSDLYPCIDKENRIVCCFTPGDIGGITYERHGPALSQSLSDLVVAVNCSKWPNCASEWLTRQRHYNWPSSDLIEKCKSQGCLLVPVGHPESDEKDLQWRVSFSHQERLLVTLFNSVQLKCYILLKIVKNEILQALTGKKSITSYHCKTCMLYMIENTRMEFWVPENLLTCFISCLRLLSHCTDNGNCPNYFIPAENMFEGKIYGTVQNTLSRGIHHLLLSDCSFLIKLQTGGFAERFNSSLTDSMAVSTTPTWSPGKQKMDVTFKLCQLMKLCQRRIKYLQFNCSSNLESNTKYFYRHVQELSNTRKIPNHTEEETQRAISLILPYMELNLMSNLIAVAVNQSQSVDKIWRLLASDKWHELSLKSDSFSSKLKQASLMHMLGYYHVSLDVLSALVTRGRYSICECKEHLVSPTSDSFLLGESFIRTASYFLNRHMIPCVVFLPTEKNVTPPALCYEMIRSDGMPQGSRVEHNYFWYDWAVVDGQFLLQFLLYLNHSKLGMRSHVAADVDNMNMVINTVDISHRETCLNLLGWVYKEEGCTDRAVECFHKSLEIQPQHNAAFWHMMVTISDMTGHKYSEHKS